MPTKGTPATPIRFTADDLAKIDHIKTNLQLDTRAAAVRFAVRWLARATMHDLLSTGKILEEIQEKGGERA